MIFAIYQHRPPAFTVEIVGVRANLRATLATLGALSLAGARQLVPRGLRRWKPPTARAKGHLVEVWTPREAVG